MNTTQYSPTEKWEIDISKNGYSILPNQVFFINHFLSSERQLSATELLLMLNLLTWWWHKDAQPFPSKSLLASRLGLSPRQVQRTIKSLEDKQMLKTRPRYEAGKQTSNLYDLSLFVEIVRKCVSYLETSPFSNEVKKVA
ncbi:MAG: hypothetical protein GC185_13120 [Alphaproteobacteria bacterium]|nr:hypothetical protein [Alphaproteobacteria bacterium]